MCANPASRFMNSSVLTALVRLKTFLSVDTEYPLIEVYKVRHIFVMQEYS